LIVTRKRGNGRYYFALWQTNNNTPNKRLPSESAVSCLLRVRSVSFTSCAKGCIKFVPHSCLVSLSHKVGVFLEEAICYFMYAKIVNVMYKYERKSNLVYFKWGWSKSPFDINSVVFHFDDFNYGRRSQPYFF
jgi:hypothetical protein